MQHNLGHTHSSHCIECIKYLKYIYCKVKIFIIHMHALIKFIMGELMDSSYFTVFVEYEPGS